MHVAARDDAGPLLGREAETRLLTSLLDGIQSSGGAPVLRGEPGLHVRLLWLAISRAWWTDPGPAARRILVGAARRLGGAGHRDPRVLAILGAFDVAVDLSASASQPSISLNGSADGSDAVIRSARGGRPRPQGTRTDRRRRAPVGQAERCSPRFRCGEKCARRSARSEVPANAHDVPER